VVGSGRGAVVSFVSFFLVVLFIWCWMFLFSGIGRFLFFR